MNSYTKLMLLKLHYYCHIKAILYPLISHSQLKFGRHDNITVNDKAKIFHNYIHYKLSIINIRKIFDRLEHMPTRDLRVNIFQYGLDLHVMLLTLSMLQYSIVVGFGSTGH